jgi:hypothetical protein
MMATEFMSTAPGSFGSPEEGSKNGRANNVVSNAGYLWRSWRQYLKELGSILNRRDNALALAEHADRYHGGATGGMTAGAGTLSEISVHMSVRIATCDNDDMIGV